MPAAVPTGRFHVVGGYEGDRAPDLLEAGNVALHGEKPHGDLPALRARFDVEIIPFRLSALTHAVDPVKLYEAAAAGRPIVATRMRALEPLAERGLVRLADGAEDFAAAIEAAAAEAAAAAPARRAFARENTWDARAETLAGWLEGLYPLASIVVVTFQNVTLNRMCIESIYGRTEWPNFEVLVVDNASSDGTLDYLREAEWRHPNLRVLRNEENRGFAAANNQGLKEATGRYLILLNNDTVVSRGWATNLIRHLHADPRLGLVGPVTNEIGNEAKIEVGYRDLAGMPDWAAKHVREHDGETFSLPMLAMFCVAPAGTSSTAWASSTSASASGCSRTTTTRAASGPPA